MILVPIRALDGSTRTFTLLDDCDHEHVRRWSLCGPYAKRFTTRDGHKVFYYLHREILGLVPGDGLEGDHINGCKLDNRRANLRIVTHAQNGQNRRGGYGRSEHRGIYWHEPSGRWVAQHELDGRAHYIGSFADERHAAEAAAAFRAQHMPFATA